MENIFLVLIFFVTCVLDCFGEQGDDPCNVGGEVSLLRSELF